MPQTTIDRLIINSPYEEPRRHWRYERKTRTFSLVEGRRPAGYVVASGKSKTIPALRGDAAGHRKIRPRVASWRVAVAKAPGEVRDILLQNGEAERRLES